MQCWTFQILTEECLFEGLFRRRRSERGDWRGVWLQGQNLKVAAAEGHLVGLHSHFTLTRQACHDLDLHRVYNICSVCEFDRLVLVLILQDYWIPQTVNL